MIIIALPGNSFFGPAFLGLVRFINYLDMNDYKYGLNFEGGSNVSLTREKCMGITDPFIDNRKAIPFNSALDYSHIMWIDSDILFNPPDFKKLLDRNVDIVAGCYKKNNKLYPMSKLEDLPDGESMKCLEDSDLQGEDLIEAMGFGLGFTLIKKGVFEKIERPWFETKMVKYAGKEHFVTEDVYFCLKAREAGFKLWLDPTVKVKHLKPRIL